MRGRTAPVACLAMLMLLGGCGRGAGYRGYATAETVRTVSVFYATDRDADSTEPGSTSYGYERGYYGDERAQLGVCQVEIRRERSHDKAGPLPTSSTPLLSIVSTTSLEDRRFWERLREKMWYADANETFVFIHGFNNSFDNAVRRTAELWYDVGFEGPPIVYSWPSRGGSFWRGVFGYFADSETIKWSISHLKEFLVDLVEETTADKLVTNEPARIHLVAHSMGSRALVRALMLVADEMRHLEEPIFCDVILAAPDIDRDLFRDVIALELLRSRLAEHYTLYASSSDEVIRTSQRLQVYPRAGNADDGLVAIDHDAFDTIDASSVQSDSLSLNHDYFITEPRVIRDLAEILRRSNRDPSSEARDMARRDEAPGAPWLMLPDAIDETVVVVEPQAE